MQLMDTSTFFSGYIPSKCKTNKHTQKTKNKKNEKSAKMLDVSKAIHSQNDVEHNLWYISASFQVKSLFFSI
jgi:hypothetical protein